MTSLSTPVSALRTCALYLVLPRSVWPLLVMVLAIASAAAPALAGEAPSTADASARALEQLRAANVARAELAREQAAWNAERERLHAAIAATRAEVARLERDAAEAEAQRDAARSKIATLASTNDIAAVRERLQEAGTKIRDALAALAATVPPGAITLPATNLTDEDLFDASVRALDAAERAAGTLGVEVVSGIRGGQREAVKLLRVAGAVAWWVSLDGKSAGIARVTNGGLVLDLAADEAMRINIIAALAQAEGRAHPTVVVLPAPSATAGGGQQ